MIKGIAGQLANYKEEYGHADVLVRVCTSGEKRRERLSEYRYNTTTTIINAAGCLFSGKKPVLQGGGD